MDEQTLIIKQIEKQLEQQGLMLVKNRLEERILDAYYRKWGKYMTHDNKPTGCIKYFTVNERSYAIVKNEFSVLAVYSLYDNGTFRFNEKMTLEENLRQEEKEMQYLVKNFNLDDPDKLPDYVIAP
jgi:hypothetical protein